MSQTETRKRPARKQSNNTFVFNNEPYMRVTPSKQLFHSTTVYEVITRGDFFAVNLATGILTILKGGSDVATA